jgi:lysophospholipase L1-like esterase
VRAPILLAAALASLSLAGCGGDSAVGTLTTVGDSLNVGDQPYLDDELGGWSIDHHDQGGRRTQEGIDELDSLGRDVGQVLVVSLGTNDVDGDPATFRRQVEEVVARAGPRRCVIWMTIWLGGPHPFNDVLRGSAALHRNLHLLDWAELVEQEPELLASDGVHATPDGYARRAEEIARVARECLPPAQKP